MTHILPDLSYSKRRGCDKNTIASAGSKTAQQQDISVLLKSFPLQSTMTWTGKWYCRPTAIERLVGQGSVGTSDAGGTRRGRKLAMKHCAAAWTAGEQFTR
jgi:hypothetical protein